MNLQNYESYLSTYIHKNLDLREYTKSTNRLYSFFRNVHRYIRVILILFDSSSKIVRTWNHTKIRIRSCEWRYTRYLINSRVVDDRWFSWKRIDGSRRSREDAVVDTFVQVDASLLQFVLSSTPLPSHSFKSPN